MCFGIDLLTFVGLAILVYTLIYIIGIIVFDCDLRLAFSEKFGQPVDVLKGKVVWITGASSGIGEYLAKDLARYGVKLVLSARREDELLRVKEQCLGDNSTLKQDDILVLPLDVRAVESHREALESVIKHFGKLDILVNNAGRSQRAQWEDIELEVDRQLFDLNVFSVLSLSRVAVRYFMEKGEGHIAVTSSLAGITDVPFSASYTGSKHAIHGYFNSLRTEKAGKNITVTLLCPGPVFTNFLAEAFTAKTDQKFGEPVRSTDKRMSAERCGHLCAVALANKIDEAWITIFPILGLIYFKVYFPNFSRLMMKFITPEALLKLRDSRISMNTK